MKNYLRAYRQNAGLTLQELGDMAGTSKSHIHAMEKDSNPTLRLAYAISRVLDAQVYDIWPDTTEIVEETIVVRRVKSSIDQ